MQLHFTSSQSVELAVEEQSIPIQHYLRQPQRLIKALADPTRTEQLSSDCFRLKMRPFNFLMLTIQPTVDIQVWAESDGTIHLRSVGCHIKGVDYINQRFNLKLIGQLSPTRNSNQTVLLGRADLAVSVDLPPAFWMTPQSLLEATGNGLLNSVLMSIKQRLMYQLLADYYYWVKVQSETTLERTGDRSTALLSPNTPTA